VLSSGEAECIRLSVNGVVTTVTGSVWTSGCVLCRGASSGSKQAMSWMQPMVSAAHRARTRMPV